MGRPRREKARSADAYLEPPASRAVDPRLAAVCVAALAFLGGLMGSVNLLVDGVLRDGAPRWLYGGTMALLLIAAVPIGLRSRLGRWETFGLVLLGDLIYVVVAVCIEDPIRYATPLMLLFPAIAAAWFLDRWMFAVHLALTPVAVAAGLWNSYANTAGLVIQICVNAGVLASTTFGVYLLRRRVQRLLAATQELSRLDPLTGLCNRRHLEEQAARVWRQARREGSRVTAMVLDLDHFKALNDEHGHAAGDAVLKAVAEALSSSVRPSDVLARLGGEELVVLGMVSDPAEANRLAERLRRAVASTRTDGGHGVTASIGIALVRPADGEDPADGLWRLIDRADGAMYEAKQAGRDRVAAMITPRPRTAPDDAHRPTGTAGETAGTDVA
ncbi:diguanylate cyclase domain-containing protein [Blastococcus sp. SYSU D00820]